MRRFRFLLFLLLALIGVSIFVHYVPLGSRLGGNGAIPAATGLALGTAPSSASSA